MADRTFKLSQTAMPKFGGGHAFFELEELHGSEWRAVESEIFRVKHGPDLPYVMFTVPSLKETTDG